MATVHNMFLVLALSVLSSQVMSEPLPRFWVGTYYSHRGVDVADCYITIEQVVTRNGRITAKGKGAYSRGGEVTHISVEWVVNLDTQLIQMWEHGAVGAAEEYDDNGSYSGAISRELDTIVATWRNWGANDSGTLKLQAVEALPDHLGAVSQ